MLNILGYVSNTIAAVCAVIAIKVTVNNYKSDREAQTKEKLCNKFRELYKQAVIDDFLETEDKKIYCIGDSLYKVSRSSFDENTIKEIYNNMTSVLHDCLRNAEIIKFFNRKLYQDIKQIIENIFDTYSKIINKAIEHKFVSPNFERSIRVEWIELRNAIYKCYIDEDYDELDKYAS